MVLDRPQSLQVPCACLRALAQPRVCTPSALHHCLCLCWRSGEIGHIDDAMAGDKLDDILVPGGELCLSGLGRIAVFDWVCNHQCCDFTRRSIS
jgi:hypothetical protein